jgi:RNA polymerase sigma factor (sigma-70 family)
MTPNDTSRVIQHLRRILLPGEGGKTDATLLACFIEGRDEAAFAALVQRYSRVVWNVCRRLLNEHDAEDAFQATFLVLYSKAASIRQREMLASWLHRVAHHTALHARRAAARRRVREKQVVQMPEPCVAESDISSDLRPVLDEELSRLPESNRIVIVLCDLAGKTRQEVARQLGCPEGTVASRLARARGMLAKRLTQRGVALSAGALPMVLARQAVSASVPMSLIPCTIKAAGLFAAGMAATGATSAKVVVLAEGVLKTMCLTKLKSTLTAMILLTLLGGGPVAWVCYDRACAAAGEQERNVDRPIARPAPPQPEERREPAPIEPPRDDDAFAGQWRRQFEKLMAQNPDQFRGKYPVDLHEVHNNPVYKNTCALCHKEKAPAAKRIDGFLDRQWGETVIIRLPGKANAIGEAEFLRRICLDILGRPATPLELDYYLKDTDPQKGRKVVEKLLKEKGLPYIILQPKPGAPGDPAKPKPSESKGRAEVERLWLEFLSVPPAPGAAGNIWLPANDALQTLMFMNGPVVQQQIEARGTNLLARILKAYPDDAEALRWVYVHALGRLPTEREAAQIGAYLRTTGTREEGFESILWALVNSTEFEKKRDGDVSSKGP